MLAGAATPIQGSRKSARANLTAHDGDVDESVTRSFALLAECVSHLHGQHQTGHGRRGDGNVVQPCRDVSLVVYVGRSQLLVFWLDA